MKINDKFKVQKDANTDVLRNGVMAAVSAYEYHKHSHVLPFFIQSILRTVL